MPKAPSRKLPPIRQLVAVMAALRAPDGCPWDREQDHRSLRSHAVEEVYELIDAIEAGDDAEMSEELGDLLLQVVFHAQLASERGAFDFDGVCQRLVDKLVRRHPHVFGSVTVDGIDQVWANWESIKKAEKAGSRHERKSALDGVPRHLPALMRAQKLLKKAAKAGLEPTAKARPAGRRETADALFDLAARCQEAGWSAEELLRAELARREAAWRREERRREPPVVRRVPRGTPARSTA
ncbi:MAG: MazG family protein [Verrucomicrobium sp.]|jgi:NTP pyrophosphatase (non-canonical NTP hydrolase)|nr:MazG family protein [Verrucomicrobium sp.]